MGEQVSKAARRGIWRQRRVRLATGLNVSVSLVLAAAVVVMVNFLSLQYHHRWDLSWQEFHKLSPKTVGLLSSLEGDLRVLAFFRSGGNRFEEIRYLLKEYEHAAAEVKGLKFDLEFVDPDRDVIRAGELAQQYGLTEDGVVVFEADGRRKYVAKKEIFETEVEIEGRQAFRRYVAFHGERVFSSAIQSVTQMSRPILYFLTGHGERAVDEFGKHSGGYSILGREILRDNMEVRKLLLAEHHGVPKDCSALVIAGPARHLSEAEVDLLAKYLENNGRVLLMLDAGGDAGLAALLKRWGVKLDSDVVAGMTLTGRELVITHYGEHSITRGLANVATMFYSPRSIESALAGADASAQPDRPRVTVLARSVKGWADKDMRQSPPRFDEGVDRPGPVGVAVAVERGAVRGIDMEIRPTRVVVVGDSDFASNGALTSGVGGNRDFVMSALNWLVEREALLAIAPKPPQELRLDMDGRQIRTAYLVMVAGIPALAAIAGILVWLSRRN
jgi:hypothetical protein